RGAWPVLERSGRSQPGDHHRSLRRRLIPIACPCSRWSTWREDPRFEGGLPVSETVSRPTPLVARVLPGLHHLVPYQRSWLRYDVVAGLVLVTLLVPQGMAYAELAGLPAITGLYTTAVALLAYALFGPSRVLVLGPDSSLGPVIAATISPLIAPSNSPAEAVAYASILALLVGAITVTAGLLRLGFVA